MMLFVGLSGVLSLVGCSPCDRPEGCVVGEDLSGALLSVRAPEPGDVWMVGASATPDDGAGPLVLHREGDELVRIDTSEFAGAELWWAWIADDEAVFVGDGGTIVELDRGSGALTSVSGPDAETTFFGVWGASPDDVWAVGQTQGGSGPPALWRRTDGTWAAFDAGLPSEDGDVYFKVHGTSASDVWLVGSAGTSAHWDGTAWSAVETGHPTAPLLTVDTSGERPIAVGGAGNGIVLEYDGSAWLDVSPDFQPGFNGVCAGAGTAWAVGQFGARAQRIDGVWVSDDEADIEPSTLQDWHGCAIEPDGTLWMVGGALASRPLDAGVVVYVGGDVPDAIEP